MKMNEAKRSKTEVLRKNLSQVKYCGGYSGGVPPLPIPNREVKPAIADGTAPPGGRVGSCRSSKVRLENPAGPFCVPSPGSGTHITAAACVLRRPPPDPSPGGEQSLHSESSPLRAEDGGDGGVERVRKICRIANFPDFFRPCRHRVFSLRSKIADADTRFRAAGGTSPVSSILHPRFLVWYLSCRLSYPDTALILNIWSRVEGEWTGR